MAMRVGLMVWEIGDRPFLEQFAWAAAQGFEQVAFHTSPSLAPRRGIDPESMSAEGWGRLKAACAPFTHVDLHAPFDLYDVSLVTPNERVRRASVELIEHTLRLAGRLRARTVTVHAGTTRSGIADDERRRLLAESLLELDETAAALGVVVGVEATEDFEVFDEVCFESTGVTVDVGHVSMNGGASYRPWGSLGGLVRHLGRRIVHVHVHDYDGRRDHLPVGAGNIDFGEAIGALREVGYEGALCLELAPSPIIEEGYLRSRDLLRSLLS